MSQPPPQPRTPPPDPAVPRMWRRLALLLPGPLALGLFQIGVHFPGAVEGVYASWLGPTLVRGLTLVTGSVALPLVEVAVLAAAAWLGWSLFRELAAARKRGRRRGWGLASWLLGLGQTASALTAAFYLLWGFNYARPSLEARLGWDEVGEVGAEELAALAAEAVQTTNHAYRTLHGTDDAGGPTPLPADRRGLENALVRGWASAARELGLDPTLGRDHGPVKTLVTEALLSRLGLLGFYFPYTAEPVVNGLAPAVILPRSMAHEQAHQRGVAPEDEANFMAIMATTRSPDPLCRYAGFATIQRRLLNDLAALDRPRAVELARSRLPGVERDARELEAFYLSLQGPVGEVAERLNDAYLRHHRVEGGVRSYGLVTRLLVAYARQRGGLGNNPPGAPIP